MDTRNAFPAKTQKPGAAFSLLNKGFRPQPVRSLQDLILRLYTLSIFVGKSCH